MKNILLQLHLPTVTSPINTMGRILLLGVLLLGCTLANAQKIKVSSSTPAFVLQYSKGLALTFQVNTNIATIKLILF